MSRKRLIHHYLFEEQDFKRRVPVVTEDITKQMFNSFDDGWSQFVMKLHDEALFKAEDMIGEKNC